jgi:hypothetical protein
MPDDSNWPAPGTAVNARVARIGIFVFIISIFFYALAIWGVSQVLANNDIIENSIKWSDSYLIGAILQSIRLVDKAFWNQNN